MLISVITPSFNSADFLERAIKSVVDQDYANWEHIIVDGGSTDDTLSILKKYPHLHWISEPDEGQTDAMNKGFARSKGDIVVYLNADDYFFPGAFSAVIPEFKNGARFVMGNILVKSERMGTKFLNTPRITLKGMLCHWESNAFCYNPVGYFYHREVQEMCPFNASNNVSMDLEFLLDAAAVYSITKVEYTLGCFMDGLGTKTHQTQTKLDYWQPSTFPYLSKHLNRFSDAEREQYLAKRRAGYADQQAKANLRHRQENAALPTFPVDLRVSVIIPAYNCREYICRAVDSVLRQDIPSLEVLIIDDASPDDMAAVVKDRYNTDARVKVFSHDKNKKLGAARNTGLKHASGEYVFFLDADDWLEPDGLRALLIIAEQYNVDIAACGIRKVFPNGVIEPFHSFAFACNGGREALWYLAELYIGVTVWNKLYRRSFLVNNELFFLENYYHEDVLFSMRAAALCQKYISICDVYMNYFQNKNSITQTIPTQLHLASYLRIWSDIDKLADVHELKKDSEGILLLKKLFHTHASCDMMPKFKNYMRIVSKDDYEKHIECACSDVFKGHGVMAADILKSVFVEMGNNTLSKLLWVKLRDCFPERFKRSLRPFWNRVKRRLKS